MLMINRNIRQHGSVLAQPPNHAYNMLETMMIRSHHWPSKQTEYFEYDGGRTNFAAASFYNGNMSRMEEARFINNNGGYAGYQGNSYSNKYHPSFYNHENFCMQAIAMKESHLLKS